MAEVLGEAVEETAVEVVIRSLRAKDHALLTRGKCRGSSVDWYPERSNGAVQYAISVCNGTDGTGVCIVIDACLEYALANDEFGVWGGTSERERRRIKKARRLKEASGT